MHCDAARRLLPFADRGPSELPDADRMQLDAHVSQCPECAAIFRVESSSNAEIGRVMQAVPVPIGFRQRLDSRLLSNRKNWWRLRVSELLAIAVGSSLIFGLLLRATRPDLDAVNIAKATYEQAGIWRAAQEARASADDWLAQQDSRLSAPVDLNYKLLAFAGRSDFSGLKSVPTLAFVRGDSTARVFFVRESAFRSLGDAATQPVEDGGCTVSVRRYEELPGWLVVIVTGGGPVDLFLVQRISTGPA